VPEAVALSVGHLAVAAEEVPAAGATSRASSNRGACGTLRLIMVVAAHQAVAVEWARP